MLSVIASPDGVPGFAIPFHWYEQFIERNIILDRRGTQAQVEAAHTAQVPVEKAQAEVGRIVL